MMRGQYGTFGFFTILFALHHVKGAAVTLYQVEKLPRTPDPRPAGSIEQLGTTRISAIGPGESGMTRYLMEEVQSRMILHASDVTQTILDAPITFGLTLEQDATQEKASRPVTIATLSRGQIVGLGLDRTCSLDIPNGRGSCVDVVEDAQLLANGGSPQIPSFSTILTIYTTTYSGTLLPIATINPAGSIVTPSPTPTTPTSNTLVGPERPSLTLLVATILGMAVFFIS